MNFDYYNEQLDFGSRPYVANIEQMGIKNRNFRTALWTGEYMQMTLMCIPPCGEIGLEIHPDTDQLIRIEQGKAVVLMGEKKYRLTYEKNMCKNDVAFIPAGTWHNIINRETHPLKVSVIYAPPHHQKGTVHRTKEDAEMAEY